MDLQGVLNGRSVQLDALDGLERPPDLVPAESCVIDPHQATQTAVPVGKRWMAASDELLGGDLRINPSKTPQKS